MNTEELIEIDGTWFERDTDRTFAEFVNDAIRNRRRVLIVYNEGWADFSGYHGEDGLHHHCYIGRSTGSHKIPLKIANSLSNGGPGLTTCRASIKSYGYADMKRKHS